MYRDVGICKTELELVLLNTDFHALCFILNYHSGNKEQSDKTETILLGAKAYICDEHDFAANKRKVLLLGLHLMLAILTVEPIRFKQQSNYNHVGYKTVLPKLHSGSRVQLHSSSTSAASFIYFILISIQFSSTFLNRRPLCEVDLSSVIVTKGISVGISLASVIARQYEIRNSKANDLKVRNVHITLLALEKLPKQNLTSRCDQVTCLKFKQKAIV